VRPRDFIRGLGVAFSVPMREQIHNRRVRFSGEGDGLWAEPIQPASVRHWGCGAKEPRISQAAFRRHYYYLTTDERTGETKYRDKIIAGMDSIAKMPYWFMTGPNNLYGYDPAAGNSIRGAPKAVVAKDMTTGNEGADGQYTRGRLAACARQASPPPVSRARKF